MRRLATVLAIGAVALVAAGCGTGTHVAARVQLAKATFSGVDLAYPTAFHLRRFSTCYTTVTGHQHRVCDHGVVVASYPLWRGAPERHGFRNKGVALELTQLPPAEKATGVSLGDRSLTLWPFQPADDNNGPMNPPPPQQYLASLHVHGAGYQAMAWIGTGATDDERHALAHLIESVHASGVTTHKALPHPPRSVVHVLCGGSPGSPRMPSGTGAGAGGSTCAQVTGSKCRAWTQEPGAPIRERHYHLAAFICARTRRFLLEHPRGYDVEPQMQGLVLG